MLPDGKPVNEYVLTNQQGMQLHAIDYGCTITALKVPDRSGTIEDVVLGFDSLDGYLRSDHYVGCVIGRYANRIANGKFSLAGKNYSLDTNLLPHHLHGGTKGFDKKIWTATTMENERGLGIDFHHYSPDGDEGYPGNMTIYVRYFLTHDNVLMIHYLAETDQATILNPTQHSYFNLRGGKSDILNHGLILQANHYLPVDQTMLPTGELRPVDETAFDFRTIKMIGRDFQAKDSQISLARGYDHNWIIAKNENEMGYAATLFDPLSGRVMEVHTTEPGIQMYTGNHLDEKVPGKNNLRYGPYAGVCLETQHFPDSPNQPAFPSVVVHPGRQFQSTTIFKFSTVK